MNGKPNVSVFQIQDQPYLYLYVNAKQKNSNIYLYSIDLEYGGINNSSLPEIDLNCVFNTKNTTLLHSDEFLVGAFYKFDKNNKQHLIICTANTKKSLPTSSTASAVNLYSHLIYQIDQVSFFDASVNSSSQNPISISRPDLYFSPEIDLTMQFPYQEDTIVYSKVLDNNNKFCWNKELIRPFSKFYGNPCIIILQGIVERYHDKGLDIFFISKFYQTNPLDLNIGHKTEKNTLKDEIKCSCELIFPALGKFLMSSHTWTIVMTENKEEKYFNENRMNIIPFDISNKFTEGVTFNQYTKFEEERKKLLLFLFSHLYSDYDSNVNNHNHQTQQFYLIGSDLKQLLNSSLLYIFHYITDFRKFAEINYVIFSENTDSFKEIPVKKELLDFFNKCMYRIGNIFNNGIIINFIPIKDEEIETNFNAHKDICKFVKKLKSEKFILDIRHVLITYFHPNLNQKIIKAKAHFQEELVISQISIHLRHRDPSHVIKMSILIDEDTTKHHLFCQQVLLPNPDKEETYTFNFHDIFKNSLIYPIDFKFFQKTRFVTINFENNKEIDVNVFYKMIHDSDIRFVVERPIINQPHFEIYQNEINGNNINYNFCECLDIYRETYSITSPISVIRDFELARIKNAVSNYHRCIYLITNNSNPTIFDFRSYIERRIYATNRCPFCNAELTKSNSYYYEFSSVCPLFITQTDNQTENSFCICDNCSSSYINQDQIKPISKSNKKMITNESIQSFLNKNKSNIININEFIDSHESDLPYQTEPDKLINVSQNASVYRHSLKNYTTKEIQKLLRSDSKCEIKFTKEFCILLFFQYEVTVCRIEYTIHSPNNNNDNNIQVSARTTRGRQDPTKSFNTPSLELLFESKDKSENIEFVIENIKIFGKFLPPKSNFFNQSDFEESKVPNLRTFSFSIFEKKPEFEDKFKSIQSFSHSGAVKGYQISIKKGQILSSLVVAYFNEKECIGYRCFLLPDKANENRSFYIPEDFDENHNIVKFYYLDRQQCDSVSIKLL